jgi:hypothetical protein
MFLHQAVSPLFGLAFGGVTCWEHNSIPREIPGSDNVIATLGDFLGPTLFLHRGLPLRLTWFFGGVMPGKTTLTLGKFPGQRIS